MSELLFKVLDIDGSAFHGGNGAWSLPTKNEDGTWTPGDWMEIQGDLEPCRNGYHLCREQDLIHWLGPAIYAAEYRGERVDANDKVVVSEARLLFRYGNWNERSARLFACDCAERVSHLCDSERSSRVIDVARRYTNGQATRYELNAAGAAAWDAARAAAWAAAWDAARAAAWAAAWAAVGDADGAAAWAAARAAAWAAAWAAVGDADGAAAWAAERQWQTEQLMQRMV